MKKLMVSLQQKSASEIEKDVAVLRNEITKLKIDQAVNAGKDSNQISKRIKQIAQLLTVATDNKQKASAAKTK